MKHPERILIFLVSITAVCAQVFENNQFWHAEKFQKKINDKTSLSLEQDFRLGENLSDLHYIHADFGIKRQLTQAFSLNLNFREVFEQKGEKLTREHRPYVQVAWKGKSGFYSLSGRARMEYRMKQNKDPFLRNRDMITVKFGKGFTPLKLVPYVADEIFYDLKESELNRNRFYVGFEIKSISFMKARIYYLQQSDLNDNEWKPTNVVGMKFSF